MADLINLRRYRKKKAREAAELTAAERRLAFGVSKVQRNADDAAKQKRDAALDGHRRIREDET
ncbi:hypothetical protein J2X65_001563 [Ancylobacter sp. 3268]|uniref:DUF4169 family protein n=1 Tax=Ancylobacter sp. 3268 TaxID=2817752 RepID=UPI00285AD233|nr:DUF4169 family protein [Ancylobacter sp. 3268]MDR6952212.1 hypothetical protein [Ancylobacter sp. 3268]